MAHLFEVRDGNRSVGPFSGDQIRQLAADGTLNAGMDIRRLPDGAWAPLSNVKGLRFKSPPVTTAPAVSTIQAAPVQSAPSDFDALAVNILSQAVPAAAAGPAEIECPYCSELIKATAKKCKHCGEFLDDTVRAGSSGSRASPGANVQPAVSSGSPAPRHGNVDLDTVAMNQNRLRFCGLAFWLFQLLAVIAPVAGLLLFDSEVAWQVPFYVSWLFNYAAAVFAFFLAMKVYDAGMGTTLGLLGLIPYIGPIGFLLVSAQATYLLRQHGRRGRPRWLAVTFPAAVLSPAVFIGLALALNAWIPVDPVAPGPTPIFAVLGTAIFFGAMLVLALIQKG